VNKLVTILRLIGELALMNTVLLCVLIHGLFYGYSAFELIQCMASVMFNYISNEYIVYENTLSKVTFLL